MCQKKLKDLVLVLEMAVLEHFWWEHSHGPLGVNRDKIVPNVIFEPSHFSCFNSIFLLPSEDFQYTINCIQAVDLQLSSLYVSLCLIQNL